MLFIQIKTAAIVLSLPVFISCSNSNENELKRLFMLHINTLKNTETISAQTTMLYRSIQEKMKDPATKERATSWNNKAEAASKEFNNLYNYIDSLKMELRKEAGLGHIDYKTVAQKDYSYAVRSAFLKKNKANELYQKLSCFSDNILNTDEEIKKEFQNKIMIMGTNFKSGENAKELFTQIYFTDISLASALLVLSNIQESLRRNENMIVTFCHSNCYNNFMCGFVSRPTPIAVQNSSIVKAGDPIEITAGIGTFFAQANPIFTINNKKMPDEDNAVAVYKINTKKQSGKYRVPVKIEYDDASGSHISAEKIIEYEVIKEDSTGSN